MYDEYADAMRVDLNDEVADHSSIVRMHPRTEGVEDAGHTHLHVALRLIGIHHRLCDSLACHHEQEQHKTELQHDGEAFRKTRQDKTAECKKKHVVINHSSNSNSCCLSSHRIAHPHRNRRAVRWGSRVPSSLPSAGRSVGHRTPPTWRSTACGPVRELHEQYVRSGDDERSTS